MTRTLSLAAALLCAAFAAAPAAANVVRTENVEAELVADAVSIAPGQTFYVALSQKIAPHWHTYWKNPGDSGEPTRVLLDLPEGWTAEEIVWPAPERLPFGPLVNYGYSDEVLLPIAVTPPADLDAASVTLNAEATWLVCYEICIPEDGAFTLDLLVTQTPRANPNWADPIADALAGAPRPLGADAILARQGETVALHVADAELGDPDAVRDLYFFPELPAAVEPAAAQPAAFYGDDGLTLDLSPGFALRDDLPPMDGVLAFERRADGGWVREAVHLTAAPGAIPALGAPLAVQAGIETHTRRYPLESANAALDDLRAGRLEGAAVLVP